MAKGNDKVRLTAKNGVYEDTAANRRRRDVRDQIRTARGSGDIATLNRITEEQRALAANGGESYDRGNYSVVFELTPEITESGSAQYADVGDIRGPASVLWYQGSPSRTFSINAKFIARTSEEATVVARNINYIKSWRMPEDLSGGAVGLTPPTLLYLEGYRQMLREIPVVLTDYSLELTSEHDGIISDNGNFVVPIYTTMSLSLKEAHSLEGGGLGGDGRTDGLDSFNILDYRLGNLQGW